MVLRFEFCLEVLNTVERLRECLQLQPISIELKELTQPKQYYDKGRAARNPDIFLFTVCSV